MTSTYPHCPTASHLSSLTRHFVVGISRMEMIAHVRTSSNDHRSHRYDTCIPILYELNYLCPFLGPPVLFYLWFCRPTSMIAQELILISKDLPSPCIAGGLFLLRHKKSSDFMMSRNHCFVDGCFATASFFKVLF